MERTPFVLNFGKMPKQYISREIMPVSELLEITKQKKNEFSQYRERLQEKGFIDVSERGLIKLKLPRLGAFVANQIF